jgi:hypothetical protein
MSSTPPPLPFVQVQAEMSQCPSMRLKARVRIAPVCVTVCPRTLKVIVAGAAK